LNIIENDIIEYYLPKDLPHFCCGCNNCFMQGEEFCPHQDNVTPIKNAIWDAELLIFTSPVYVMHVTGQMKAFLDHFAFQFMAHRPNGKMFSKTALIISLGAGGGMDTTIKEISISMDWWGISRVYKFGYAVKAAKWDDVTEKNKTKIERKIKTISNKINKNINKPKTNLKIKGYFYFCRMIQKKYEYIPYDKEYWEKHGWLNKKRPWKNR
jgi:multimeric flavodoxin WrbA